MISIPFNIGRPAEPGVNTRMMEPFVTFTENDRSTGVKVFPAAAKTSKSDSAATVPLTKTLNARSPEEV